jgi:hypothetical protein
MSWISGWKFLDYISLSCPKKRVLANEPNSKEQKEVLVSFHCSAQKGTPSKTHLLGIKDPWPLGQY